MKCAGPRLPTSPHLEQSPYLPPIIIISRCLKAAAFPALCQLPVVYSLGRPTQVCSPALILSCRLVIAVLWWLDCFSLPSRQRSLAQTARPRLVRRCLCDLGLQQPLAQTSAFATKYTRSLFFFFFFGVLSEFLVCSRFILGCSASLSLIGAEL